MGTSGGFDESRRSLCSGPEAGFGAGVAPVQPPPLPSRRSLMRCRSAWLEPGRSERFLGAIDATATGLAGRGLAQTTHGVEPDGYAKRRDRATSTLEHGANTT